MICVNILFNILTICASAQILKKKKIVSVCANGIDADRVRPHVSVLFVLHV